MSSRSRWAVGLGFFLGVVGCGRDGEPTFDGRNERPAEKKALASWPADAIALHVDLVGASWGAWGPEGSACELNERHWTLDATTLVATASRCTTAGPDVPFELKRASRTLSRDEYEEVVSTVEALELSSRTACGADGGTLTATIRTRNGSKTYYDDFVACAAGGNVVVTSATIGALENKLSSLIPL